MFLRGAALALPLLDSMIGLHALAEAAPSRRLGFFTSRTDTSTMPVDAGD